MVDPYSPCPGGLDKKLKFCCTDLAVDLEKLNRMLEGEQRAAALDQLTRLEAEAPDRACLLSLKCELNLTLRQNEQAAQAQARMQELFPDNPLTYSLLAMLRSSSLDQYREAIAALQQAFDHSPGDDVHEKVALALTVLANLLMMVGDVRAARAHMLLLATLLPEGPPHQQAIEGAAQLLHLEGVALLEKQEWPLSVCPQGAPWKAEFDESIRQANRACWRKAGDILQQLTGRAGSEPAVWKNLATLRGWTAEHDAMAEALHRYATLEVPLDDAVDAEAVAQLFDPTQPADQTNVLQFELPVTDTDALIARLQSSRQAFPSTPPQPSSENEPPAKAAFALLDRAIPGEETAVTLDNVPAMVGVAAIYGKQTDRAARLEASASESNKEALLAALSSIAGDAIGAVQAEKVVGAASTEQRVLAPSLAVPAQLKYDERAKLVTAGYRRALFERWTQTPQHMLGGKSPRDAAPDPQYRVKLFGAILKLELGLTPLGTAADFNALRRELGLPEAGDIDIGDRQIDSSLACRLHRLDPARLSDEQLLMAFQYAELYDHPTAVQRLGLAIVGRESLNEKVDKAQVYGILAQHAHASPAAVDYLNEARKLDEARGRSPALWKLEELSVRIARQELPEVERLIQNISSQHGKEPNVGPAMMRLLVNSGLIDPSMLSAGMGGAMRGAPPARMPAGPAMPGAPAMPVAPSTQPAPAEGSKLWTPDSGPPTAGTTKKSGLWIPD